MWDLKIDTRRLVEGFSTSVLWDRPNILWNKADDWWNDNYVTDSNTAAFLSATGIIDPNKQNYVNNLVIALKNQGLWNKMKAIYPFISEQRNYLNYTEDFSNSYWTKAQLTFTVGQSDALGGNNATQCVGNSATNAYIYGSCSTVVGETYTASVYIKGDVAGSVSFRVDSGGSSPSNPINYTTSWQRFTYTYVAGNTNSDWVIGGYNTWTGSETIYIYAPQLDLGSTATAYQVTINAQEQFAAAYKYNLKDPQDTDAAFRLKIFGTWTFSPTGATPNGTNAYMDTGYNVNTEGLLDSAHMSAYIRQNIAGQAQMGCYTSFTNAHYLYARFTDNLPYIAINAAEVIGAASNAQAFWIGSRINSTVQKLYRNNSTVINSSTTTTLKIPRNIYIGAANGATVLYGNTQTAFNSIGDGLTDAEAAAFYTIVQQFQTSMNRQINP